MIVRNVRMLTAEIRRKGSVIIMNVSTKETCPVHIWLHESIVDSRCSVEEANGAVTRERLLRWYQAGEPVWMAAQSIRIMVADMRRVARSADDGFGAIRAARRASVRLP